MDNGAVSASVKDGVLTMKVKLDPRGLSKNGKPLLASTHGFADIPGTDLRLSLNVVKASQHITLKSV